VSSPCHGRIVWVEVADPQGRNPKRRPAVIVTPTEEIQPDGMVRVVAISTQFEAAPPEVQVELPWDRRGTAKTQLRQPC
jgi:mRNA-degrading endonuclease toxin of MazEF toxin-antitoxin module